MQFSENDHEISPRKHANFRLTSFVVSEIEAFKRDLPRCDFVHFSVRVIFFSDLDCYKFCTIKDRNFKFSSNAQLLVHCNAHRKEHLTMHYGWNGNVMKMSKSINKLQHDNLIKFSFSLAQ